MKPTFLFYYDYAFGHLILPNALPTEVGIIYYLHSLHNSNSMPGFIEEVTNEKKESIYKQIFGNSLGSTPFTRPASSILCQTYRSYFDVKEQSLAIGIKTSVQKYIYPVNLHWDMDFFIASRSIGYGGKVAGEYFWKSMSDRALQDARNNRSIVILDYGLEQQIFKKDLEDLHLILEQSQIPKNNIILIVNAFNAQEVYESWFQEHQRRLIVKSIPHYIVSSSYDYSRSNRGKLTINEFINSESYERPNYFLFKIRQPRDHRLVLLFKLASDNLLDKGDWSCLNQHAANYDIGNLERYDVQVDKDKVEKLKKIFPHYLQSEVNRAWGNDAYSSGTVRDQDTTAYKNSYFYICTESAVDGELQFFTEKIVRPMVNFMPFIYMGGAGCLQRLRSMGFKTFNGFINEDYDNESNFNLRFKLIYKEISRLCAMPKKDLHDWYWKMKGILIHNYNLALTIYQNEPQTLELVRYLSGRLE